MINKIFTYGTLQRGLSNSFYIEDSSIKNIKKGTVKGTLYEVQGVTYPAVLFNSDKEVEGELYEIHPNELDKVMKSCDTLEGHPTLYIRKIVKVTDEDGKVHIAYAYEFNMLESLGPEIESGSYRKWIEENKDYIEYLEYLRSLYYRNRAKIQVYDDLEDITEGE